MNYTPLYLEDLISVVSYIPGIEKLRGKKILITGATGLVCSAIADLIQLLNEQYDFSTEVYLAARSREKAEARFSRQNQSFLYLQYDALKELSFNIPFDFIIHGASPANPSLYISRPVETMLANIQGMENLLSYARKHNEPRVLFISSSEVYGKKDSSEPYRHDDYGYVDILNPRACYPSAKRACETLCASYHQEYGVDSVIVRLGHIYGPTATQTDSRVSSQFFYDVISGKDIIMKSNGMQLRSYCYVADCVSAILTVLINGESCKAYNISNYASIVTIRELAETIADTAGVKVIFENPTEAEKKGFNFMSNSSLDSSLLEALGWRGIFDIKTGVEHTIQILKGDIA